MFGWQIHSHEYIPETHWDIMHPIECNFCKRVHFHSQKINEKTVRIAPPLRPANSQNFHMYIRHSNSTRLLSLQPSRCCRLIVIGVVGMNPINSMHWKILNFFFQQLLLLPSVLLIRMHFTFSSSSPYRHPQPTFSTISSFSSWCVHLEFVCILMPYPNSFSFVLQSSFPHTCKHIYRSHLSSYP